jgi:hypothetical protein
MAAHEAAAGGDLDYPRKPCTNFTMRSTATPVSDPSAESDGSITVDVHQVVRDAHTGELLSATSVRHRYRLEDDMIVRMDVLEQNAQP